MKNQKFKVANGTISALLQEELFKQGYEWPSHGKNVANTDKSYLYTYADGEIRYGDMHSHFNEHTNTEYRVVTESKLTIAELQPVREKVIVFGKTYFKDDVDAALAKLEIAFV